MNLTIKDYKDILDFYKINYNNMNNKNIVNEAHKILVNKLCICINNIKTNKNLKSGYGICNKSVMINKGIKSNKFKCKKKKRFIFKKTKRLQKLNKRITKKK